MKPYFKRQRTAFYASICSAILAVVGLILYIACANGGYYNDLNIFTIGLFVVTGLCAAVLSLTGDKFDNDSALRLLHIVIAALLAFIFVLVLNARVFSFAILLGSNLEASNTEAYTRLYYSIASMGAIMLAGLANIIGGFTKLHAE